MHMKLRAIRALALTTLPVLIGCACSGPPAVILSTDTGCEIDDQWALAYLLLLHEAGEVDLRAVVTSHAPNLGDRPTEHSARVARQVIDLFDPASDHEVLAGSSTALREPQEDADERGARRIVEESERFSSENRLMILTIGAGTDVARAILLDPSVVDRIDVVAMGFEGWPRGGDPWNVKNDPRAYEIILGSRAPLTIGPADTCIRHLALDAEKGELVTRGGGDLGDALLEDLRGWLRDQPDACRQWTGRHAWPIWDMITVAHLLGLTTWEEYSRPRLLDDLTFAPGPQGDGRLRWVTEVDGERVWSDFQTRLERHARARRSDS